MNLHYVALQLHMTVADLLDAMSSAEYFSWLEYFSRDPSEIGDDDIENMSMDQLAAATGAK